MAALKPLPDGKRRQPRAAWALFLLLATHPGCGTFVGNPDDGDNHKKTAKPNDRGAVTVALTDAPVDGMTELWIKPVAVVLVPAAGDARRVDIADAREVNLLALQDGVTATLFKADDVLPGAYAEMRLVLDEAHVPRVVAADGTSHDLSIPSGAESGLKIKDPFTIAAGDEASFTVDFDARRSLALHPKGDGSYVLNPVLRLVDDAKAADLEGAGLPDGAVVCVYPKGTAKKDDDDACRSSRATATVKNGRYKVAFLEEGDYEIRVFTKDGKKSDGEAKTGKAKGKPAKPATPPLTTKPGKGKEGGKDD